VSLSRKEGRGAKIAFGLTKQGHPQAEGAAWLHRCASTTNGGDGLPSGRRPDQ